jgi:hypothetical protein
MAEFTTPPPCSPPMIALSPINPPPRMLEAANCIAAEETGRAATGSRRPRSRRRPARWCRARCRPRAACRRSAAKVERDDAAARAHDPGAPSPTLNSPPAPPSAAVVPPPPPNIPPPPPPKIMLSSPPKIPPPFCCPPANIWRTCPNESRNCASSWKKNFFAMSSRRLAMLPEKMSSKMPSRSEPSVFTICRFSCTIFRLACSLSVGPRLREVDVGAEQLLQVRQRLIAAHVLGEHDGGDRVAHRFRARDLRLRLDLPEVVHALDEIFVGLDARLALFLEVGDGSVRQLVELLDRLVRGVLRAVDLRALHPQPELDDAVGDLLVLLLLLDQVLRDLRRCLALGARLRDPASTPFDTWSS